VNGQKSVPIAGYIRQKRKGFIITKDTVLTAIYVADSFKIIAEKEKLFMKY